MSPDIELLECYEAIARTSDQMLRAAQSGDWRRFDDLESDCSRMITQLRAHSATVKLAPDQQRIRLAALRRVLLADAEIRNLTEPEMQRVGVILGLNQSGPPGR
jgi:flagellar protein FliT